MDRMRFVPGKEAREQMMDAGGHLFFGRQTALDFAETFVAQAPMASARLSILYQTMLACMSEGDQVDIWFGLRDVHPENGDEVFASGELVGHTWAELTSVAGAKRTLWEVGRGTPPPGGAQAARAFNAYRAAMATFLEQAAPEPVAAEDGAADTAEWKGKPVMSRALAPSNMYFSSGRTWFFVDLGGGAEQAVLSRPVRAFDTLVLAALVTLATGSPPLVFGISNALDGLGKMPAGFTRANYEGDERLVPSAEKPLLVM